MNLRKTLPSLVVVCVHRHVPGSACNHWNETTQFTLASVSRFPSESYQRGCIGSGRRTGRIVTLPRSSAKIELQ